MYYLTFNRMRNGYPITDNKGKKKASPVAFLGVFLAVFFAFSVFLFIIDFVPEAPGSGALQSSGGNIPANAQISATASQKFPLEDPVRIQAPTVGIDAPIVNPASNAFATLNNALLSGAVRYPQSGLLGDTSRMYIFGHQTYLPTIHNQAYKTFNGLQNLKVGDEIIVYSATAAYHYQVSLIEQVTADKGVVPLGGDDRLLTLSTCDSFGTVSDRFEVQARFVSRTLLTNTGS